MKKRKKPLNQEDLAKQHLKILESLKYKSGLFAASRKNVEIGYNKAWLRDNFYGNEAWLLLSKDLRNKFYTGENDPEQLPKFSYLYRKDTDMKTQIMIPDIGNYLTQNEPINKELDLNEKVPSESIDEQTIDSSQNLKESTTPEN